MRHQTLGNLTGPANPITGSGEWIPQSANVLSAARGKGDSRPPA